jgi:hypothetical protein
VYCSGVIGFFDFMTLTGNLPQGINDKDCITSMLARSAFRNGRIFDRAAGGISQMQIDALFLFLSLAASVIIQLQTNNETLKTLYVRIFDRATGGISQMQIDVLFLFLYLAASVIIQLQTNNETLKTLYVNIKMHITMKAH